MVFNFCFSPFHSQDWLTFHSSPQYLDIIQQTGNENTQTNQVVILIQHQILVTSLQGNVLQLVGRIINQIMKDKWLIRSSFAICLIISIDFEGQDLKSTKVVSPAAVDPVNLTEPTFEVRLNGLEQNIYLSILFQWFSQL